MATDTTTSPEPAAPNRAQVGRVLGDRYALIARVGSGASATVWRARDTVLEREVAVKTLHPGLASDDGFLKRFRSEATSAASMSHVHLLAVHDWGEADEQPYLVSELLEGGSLRALLDRGLVLSASQVISLGLEACRGLHHAHAEGVIHRDIKPANLLFSKEGKLNIADFGLARALADAGWTDPTGTDLSGTARYASPEQVQGHRLRPTSDVYSLGLVLIEALTGSVPFDADTTAGALLARVERDVPLPEVPEKLAEALRSMTARDPEDRATAAKAGVALLKAAEGLPRPKPLPLAGLPRPTDVAGDPTDTAPTFDPTTVAQTRRVDPGDGPVRRWPWLVLSTVAIAAAGWFIFQQVESSAVSTRAVPNVVGFDREEALTELGAVWSLEEKFDRVSGVPSGEVIRTDPEAGVELAEDESLSYWVSLGPPLIRVPDDELVGRSREQAELTLEERGLSVGEVSRVNDESVGAGLVMAVESESPEMAEGSAVDLVVSSGPSLRQVLAPTPGQPIEDYLAALDSIGLGVELVEEFNEEIEVGGVVLIEPPPGTDIERGDQVRVEVSLGKAPIPVPNTSGSSLGDAIASLEAAGFIPGDLLGSSNARCDVVGTDPPGGTPLQPGNAVAIVLADCGIGDE